jgi:hypothetical protein
MSKPSARSAYHARGAVQAVNHRTTERLEPVGAVADEGLGPESPSPL